MSDHLIVKDCKQVVRMDDGRHFVALWREDTCLAGPLGGGYVEIDPLDVSHLNWTNVDGKDVKFPEFDDIGPFYQVTSEDFHAWYKAAKEKAGMGEFDRTSRPKREGAWH